MTSNLLTILGVQGLSRVKYTAIELKIMLRIIQLKQQFIKDSLIACKLSHDSMVFSQEQISTGHAVMVIKMAELGLGSNHNAQLRSILEGMQRKPISVPFKAGSVTCYKSFPHLFTCEAFRDRNTKQWMVKFVFDNELLSYFFSYDKGAGNFDMNVVNQLRTAQGIKLYLVMVCWATKGFTRIKTQNLMQLFYGHESRCKTWSQLERQLLLPATDDLKRLYHNQLLDQYLTYQPVYLDESTKKQHKMPDLISFTLKDRKASGEDPNDASALSELAGQRAKLKLLLQSRYGVVESVAVRLSSRLTLSMVGDLDNWFLCKEFYIERCKVERKVISLSGYIVKALDGFFKDRQA